MTPTQFAVVPPDGYVLIRKRNRVWLVGICVTLGVLLTVILAAVLGTAGLLVLFFTSFGYPLGMPEPKEPGHVDMQDVAIDGNAVDFAPTNGNWYYVVLGEDGSDQVITFVPTD